VNTANMNTCLKLWLRAMLCDRAMSNVPHGKNDQNDKNDKNLQNEKKSPK